MNQKIFIVPFFNLFLQKKWIFPPTSHTQNWVTIEILTKTTKNPSSSHLDEGAGGGGGEEDDNIQTNTKTWIILNDKLWQMYKERETLAR